MLYVNDQLNYSYADIISNQPNHIKYFPGTSFARNLKRPENIGSGVGFGKAAILGAMGEFMERFHFFNHVKPMKSGTIKDASSEGNSALTASLLKALSQLCPESVSKDIEKHPFHLTPVFNIFSLQKEFVPTVLLSLSDIKIKTDTSYLPYRDSSGQSTHTIPEMAFENALMEFIERQCLVGSWIRQCCRHRVAFNDADVELLSPLSYMLGQLRECGEIFLFDISQNLEPYVVLSLYRSKSTSEIVQYSVGLSANLKPKMAVENSLMELWSSYLFMYKNSDRIEAFSDPDQRYHQHFLNCNVRQTVDEFPFFSKKEKCISLKQYFTFPEVETEQVKVILKHVSQNILWYVRPVRIGGNIQIFGKIFSPDFFLHMDPSKPLNFENSFSGFLGLSGKNPCAKRIPFP